MTHRRREGREAKRAGCFGGAPVMPWWPGCLAHDRCPTREDCQSAGACIDDALTPLPAAIERTTP